MKFLPAYLLLIAAFNGGKLLAISSDADHERPVLNEERFLADAFADAVIHFQGSLTKSILECRFSVFQGYSVDMDRDGEDELVVAGDIVGERVDVVMVYHWDGKAWQVRVLNRARGGGIDDVQIIDINQDGISEVFSVLRDDGLRRYCRIFSVTGDRQWCELFRFDSKGGFTNSCNISLVPPSGKFAYRVRVDEVTYPDSDEGEITQQTYFFTYHKGQFVMEKREDKGSKL